MIVILEVSREEKQLLSECALRGWNLPKTTHGFKFARYVVIDKRQEAEYILFKCTLGKDLDETLDVP